MTQPTQKRPSDDPENKKNSFKESLDSWKNREKFDDMYSFAKQNTRDIIAYILLFLGIILLLFKPFWGGLLIGIVAGIYFADTILLWTKNMQTYVEREGIIRSLVFAGVILGFFIAAPGIFIGAAAALGLRQLLLGVTK